MCSTMPAISGRLRPSESDSGPTINWPSASPASVPVRVSWTTDEDTDEVVGDLRQRGQIHVDGQRAQRDHDTQHHDHSRARWVS